MIEVTMTNYFLKYPKKSESPYSPIKAEPTFEFLGTKCFGAGLKYLRI